MSDGPATNLIIDLDIGGFCVFPEADIAEEKGASARCRPVHRNTAFAESIPGAATRFSCPRSKHS